MSATLYPVHKLTFNERYHGLCHVCHTDNWYTSVEMCQLCRARNILCVGTVKVNRKGLPKEGIFPKKGAGKRVKGDVKCMQKLGEVLFFYSMARQQAGSYAVHNQAPPTEDYAKIFNFGVEES